MKKDEAALLQAQDAEHRSEQHDKHGVYLRLHQNDKGCDIKRKARPHEKIFPAFERRKRSERKRRVHKRDYKHLNRRNEDDPRRRRPKRRKSGFDKRSVMKFHKKMCDY